VKSPVVMQVVDCLEAGGLESVAVNLANLLPGYGVQSYICSTRAGGPLESRLASRQNYVNLQRRGLVDFKALWRMIRFLRDRKIDIIHAHGTALFFSALSAFCMSGVKLIWHDHFGRYATEIRPAWLYRLATTRVAGVIAVNRQLAEWARNNLRIPANRAWYVPNFVPELQKTPVRVELPGKPGKRIVCVANLRPEKDHLSLMDAMQAVVAVEPEACLLLAGSEANREHTERVRGRIRRCGLERHVILLGSRPDIPSVLAGCDIGVLSSVSEGMPLALLEYGRAGLATIATRVGQVPEVLDEGRAGQLIAPGRSAELATAILAFLRSAELRATMGAELRSRIKSNYSESAIMAQVIGIYQTVLGEQPA